MAIASTAKADVGTIKVALGDVKIIGVDGVSRAACVGDKVFAKEVIQTAANAIVQVQLADGRMLDLGRESSIALDDDLLGTTKAAKTASPTDDIAALQAAIAAGADPSKIAEATAAGGNTGGGGDNEGHEGIVVVGQANSSGPVTAGVETEPLLVAFEEPIPFIPLLQPILPQFFSQTLPPFSPPGQPEQPPEQPPTPDFPKVSVQLSVAQNTPPPVPPSGGAPVVKDDGDAIPEGSYIATGNVISGAGTTSGSAGADTPGTITGVTSPTGHTATALPDGTLVIVGQYGTLTINPDGSYVYDRDPGSPDGVVEKFTYTLTDDNGVTANADLLIDIGTPVDKPHARTDVDVVPLGSTVTTGNVITGVGTSSGAAGADTVGSDGATITGVTSVPGSPALIGPGGVITIAGEFGTLVINPDGSYVYNANPGSEGQVDHFTYTLTDGSGDSATGNLLINIGVAPDVPLGRNDVDSIPTGSTVAAGNVITGAGTSSGSAGADTQGSDGATVTGVTSPSGNPATVGPNGVITIVGEFGTLVINPDGSYIYTLDPGAHGATDTFTYTLTDGTGDTTSAGLTINLGATPDVPLAHNDTDSIPLGGTTASGNVITGAGTVGGPDNVGSDGATVTGVTSPSGNPATVGPNGVITVVGEFGTLVINPDGSYVYTLNPGPHSATESFTYTLTDGSGDTSSAGLTINLGTAPDVPVAHNDTDSIPLGGTSASGNIITGASTVGGPDNVGSDGATVTGVTSPSGNPATVSPDGVITIVGEFGTLIINPDGSYVYTLNPGPHGATDTFTYTLTDGTGDTSSAGLTINLGAAAPDVPVAHNDTDSIPLGGTTASGNVITGAGTVGGPDNVGSDGATVTGVSSPNGNQGSKDPVSGVITVVGEFGTLIINPDGSYVYTLNPGPHGATETFTYTLTDGTGDTSSAGLTINLGTAPDVPVAHNDTDSIPPGGTSASGNVITGVGTAGGPDTVGSDGATVTGVTSPTGNPATVGPDGVITIAGEFGTLIINPNGGYIYTLNPGPHGATDTFTYTLTDGTGDSSSAGLTINLGTAPQAPPGSDPSSVVLTVDGAEVLEGTYPDAKVINFVLMLDHAYTEPVQVTYQIVPGTALSPSDFFGALTATVTIPAGQTQFIVPVSIVQDHLVEGNEVFNIVLVNAVNATIDPEANTAHITIIDDDRAPLARDDTYNIIRGQSNDLPSVFTHRDPGETLDDTGAGPYESLAIVKGPNDTLLPNGDVLIATTQGGSVVMHPDGTFTYTPPESFRGPDTFTYTMTDVVNGQPIGNGTSSALVTLNPGDGSPSVTLGMAPGADQVNEAGLPVIGSASNSPSEKTTGTFTISDPDGVADILVVTINSQDILLAELNGRDIQTLIPDTSTPFGVMHIDAFDPLTGIVSFTYTLLTSVADTPNQPEQDLFTVTVTDNSETTSAPVTLAINIIDDTPQALNDTDSVAAGTFGPETGNVITGLGATSGVAGIDTPGADGATLTGVTSVSGATAVKDPVTGVLTLNGLYGVLTIEPDGDYSYTRNPGTPGGVNDVFTYTLTDGDGDTVQANLDIRIGDSPVGVHVESPKVNEAGLPARGTEPAGSDAAADSESTTGVITFNVTGGLQSVRLDGVPVTGPGQTLLGEHGTLTVTGFTHDPVTGNGTVTYSYTLTDNTSGNTTTEDFDVIVTETDGDSSSVKLTIEIKDDAPQAFDDTDTAVAGAPGTLDKAEGNVITAVGTEALSGADTRGADDVTLTNVVSTSAPGNLATQDPVTGVLTITGQYGVLTIEVDGDYSYSRNAGSPGGVVDVFRYTLTDGDGDKTAANLTIHVGDTQVILNVPGRQVNEAGLPGGSDAASNRESTTGAITFNAKDGLQSVTLDGVAVTGTGQTIAGEHGILTVTGFTYDPLTGAGAVTYSYTLTSPTQGDISTDSFQVVVTESDGDQASAPLTIAIRDDEPTALNDSDATAPGAPGTPDKAEGNVITAAGTAGQAGPDTPGADGVTLTGVSSTSVPGNLATKDPVTGLLTLEGRYGTLTIAPNGDYTYTRNPGTPGDVLDIFRYTLTDGDGDTVAANLSINIGSVSSVLELPSAQVKEAGLAARPGETAGSDAASNAEITNGALTFKSIGGLDSVTLDGVTVTGVVGQTIAGEHGILSVTGLTYNPVTGDGALTYRYELTDNTTGDTTVDDFAVVVTDKDGDRSSGTLTVNIIDDTPSISVTAAQPNALQVDESDLNADTTVDFSNRFTGIPGADGATLAYQLDVKSPGADSGLIDVASGKSIYLYENASGEVEGRVGDPATGLADPNGAIAFTVSVNPLTAEVTLNQILTLKQLVTTNPDDAVSLSAADLITLKGIITDGDGDVRDAVLNLGDAISFKDDGPTLTLNAITTGGLGLTTQDAETTGAAFDSDSANYAAAFAAAVSPNYGADGAGSTTVGGYSLNISDANSGLTSHGQPVTLAQDPLSGDIFGSTTAGEIFRLSVDQNGTVTLTQSAELDHLGVGNDLQTALANGKVNLSATAIVTDGDGDSTNSPLTLDLGGSIRFDDDGPVALANANNVAEGALLTVNTLSGVLINDTPGADGYAVGGGVVGVRAAGADISTAVTNGVDTDISGQYGILHLNADGSYTYQSTANTITGNVADVFVYTVRDADGDQATTTLTINVDNGVLTATTDDVLVDEAALSLGSNPTSTDETVSGTLADNVSGGAGGNTYSLVSSPAGSFGTLTLNADGSYSYTLTSPVTGVSANNGANIENDRETFTYRVTDMNGNVANGSFTVDIRDDVPTVSAIGADLPSLTVDESNLAVNATASFANNFSQSFGADGAGTLSYTLSTSGGASGLTDVATGQSIILVQNGNSIEGHVGNAAGATAFVITVAGNGDVTLDQQRALTHPNAANADDAVSLAAGAIILTASATDKDGDSASAPLQIGNALTFKDDGPSITVNANAVPSLTVDESNLAVNATASFANNFSQSFGADGAGTLSYTLSTSGGASGLTDVATGQSIILVQNGNSIEGHVGNAAGATAFVITVAGNGDVTLDQQRALTHPNAANADDAVSLAAGAIILTASATDKDGDSASAPLQIGNALTFKDDGPSITVNANAVPSLTVDESNLAVNATASFANNFSQSFGADGAGTLSYTLSTSGGASGLTDVATGQSIILVQNGNSIEGHVGNAAGATAFVITVAGNGDVTLDQQRALTHPNAANADDAVSLAAGAIILTASATDKDGDSASAPLQIGNALTFKDDGPSITVNANAVPSLTVDESNLAVNATASFANNFSQSFGADGAGTLSYTLSTSGGASGLTDVATGQSIILVQNGNSIEGHVGNAAGATAFVITVAGNGDVTLDQQRALTHPNAANADDAVSLAAGAIILTASATDKDGDSASAPLQIGNALTFKDDGPSITVNANAVPSLTVDESNLAVNATASFANNFSQSFGADGAGTLSYTLSTSGGASGLTDVATGQSIILVQNGNSIEGHVGNAAGATAFVITVAGNGDVTLDQQRALTHPNAANADDAVSLAAGAIILTASATDKDGDSASAPLQIGNALTFKDDGPSITVGTVAGSVEEEALAGGNQDASDIPNTGAVASGTLTGLTAFGADGGNFALDASAIASLNAQGLKSDGVTLTYAIAGDTLTAKAGTLDVFTLQVTNAGAYTFTLKDQLDHLAGVGENTLAIQFGGLVKVTDRDGDSITLGGATGANFNITVQDDIPIPCPGTIVASVDEDGLAGANADMGRAGEVAGTGSATVTGASGALAGLVSVGADQVGSFGIGSDVSSLTAQNLSSNGVALTYTVAGDTITAKAGGLEVFTLQVTSAGGYTFTLKDQLDHPTLNGVSGDNTENTMDINFGGILKVTDRDGDSITLGGTTGANFVIKVQDDIPVAANITRSTVLDVGAVTNLTLVLDVSGSMSTIVTVGGQSMSRLDAEKQSAKDLIDEYAALGPVKVSLVTFSASANSLGYWMDASAAKAAIDSIGAPNGTTNYAAGLNNAKLGYDGTSAHNGLLANAQDVLYFLSDGVPNPTATGLDTASEVTAWQNFLQGTTGSGNNIHEKITAFAIGMGPGVAATQLNPIAYNGVTNQDTNAIIVTDFAQLTQTLLSMVQVQPVAGNLITDPNPDAGYGADTVGWVQVLSVDGKTYMYDQKTDSTAGSTGTHGTFDTNTNQWTVTTSNGSTLVVDMDDGAYVYTPSASLTGPNAENFGFTLTDTDGDTASANLHINVEAPILVVGQNVSDQTGQATAHKVDAVANTAGQITGSGSSDVLIGDVGGSSLVGKQTNVILILDTSGSMSTTFGSTSTTRLQGLKDGVNDMIESLKGSGATDVRVHINHFSDTVLSGSAGAQTFDLVVNGVIQTAQVTAAHCFVDGLTAGGFTNYEAGLQEALTWVGNGAADAVNNELVGPNVVNQAIFVSDGQPNRALTGDSTTLSNVASFSNDANGWNQAMNQVLGATGSGDTVNEVSQMETKFGQIQAIGMGLDSAALARLTQLEGAGGSATNTTNAAEFKNELTSVSPSASLSAVGNDVITGGAGSDIIFGDAVNTDMLGAAKGLGLPAGSGWDVFNKLETTPAASWTRADTLNYIRTHADELAAESTGGGGAKRAGGNDTIDAGIGNDKVYGQEGNDILIGGAGNDILSGGSGADTFKWNNADKGTGAAPAVDTIQDFNVATTAANKDVLDLRDLLQGELHTAGNSGNLSTYLSFSQTGSDVTLSVKSSGTGATDQIVVLQNITMQQLGGSSATDSAGVIQSLLNNGKLITD